MLSRLSREFQRFSSCDCSELVEIVQWASGYWRRRVASIRACRCRLRSSRLPCTPESIRTACRETAAVHAIVIRHAYSVLEVVKLAIHLESDGELTLG